MGVLFVYPSFSAGGGGFDVLPTSFCGLSHKGLKVAVIQEAA